MSAINLQDSCMAELAFAYIQRKLDLGKEQLESPCRERPLVKARWLFAWIMRNHTGSPPMSYPAIGVLLGGRDHTTIMTAAQNAAAAIERDDAFAALCDGFASFHHEMAGETA